MSVLKRIGQWTRRVLAAIGYEGASTGRRTANWHPHSGSADEVARWSVLALRARSRHLVRNHWAASRAAAVLSAKVVGKGIIPSCRDDDDFDELLNRWARPQTQVGGQKGQGLGAVQRLVFRTIVESGSALVVRQFRTRRQMKERGLVMPFQVDVLEPEYLDTTKDGPTQDGGHIVHGVEYDATGWPVAYHLYEHHPDSSTHWSMPQSRRIAARDVELVLWQDRPGQTIGVPWFASVLIKLRDFDEFEDAQLQRQKIAAMFAGFVHAGGMEESGAAYDDLTLEPGTMQWLEPGESVEFTDPPDVGGFADYTHVTLRSIACGLGLTYEDLSGDFSRVNFSSARMGSITSRQLMDQWQTEMMIGLLCSKLEMWAREGAELLGVSCDSEVRWTAPRRELLDPSREVGAIERAIAAGLTSRQEEVRRLGRDVNEVDLERKQDAEREAEHGLDSDPAGEEDDAQAMRRVVEDTIQEVRMH